MTNAFLNGKGLRAEAITGRLASPNHVAMLYVATMRARVREICRRQAGAAILWL